jgi:hypothetical protein
MDRLLCPECLKMDFFSSKCDGDVPPISKISVLIRMIRRAINNEQLILRTFYVNRSLLSSIILKIPRNTVLLSTSRLRALMQGGSR